MKINQIMLFAYDFPHKKTQDFLLRLFIAGYSIKYVIAVSWRKLSLPSPSIRIAPENTGLIHPRIICQRFGIPYQAFEHNSQKTITYIRAHPIDLAIISGARILSEEVIRATKNRILNIHPALLPEIRGADPLLWSIYKDVPPGISAHLITSKIDSGLLVYKEKLKLKKDDTIIDVSLRLLEKQADVLIQALKIIEKKSFASFPNLDLLKSIYYKKMSKSYEKKTLARFTLWLKKHTQD